MTSFKQISLGLLLLLLCATTVRAQSTTTTLSGLPNTITADGPAARVDALTLSLRPLDGVLTGQAGSAVGWGFGLSWASNAGDSIAITRSSLTGDFSVFSDTYRDLLGTRGGPANGIVAAGQTWAEEFVDGTTGLGGITMRSGITPGAEYAGTLRIDFAVYKDQATALDLLGNFSIEVPVRIAAPPSASASSFQLPQASITFGPLSDRPLGSAPFVVSVTSSSSSPVTLISMSASVCSVSDLTVTLLAAGTCSLMATEDGDTDYSPAWPVSRSFEVTKASATVSIDGSLVQSYDGTPKTLGATTTPGGLNVILSYNGDTEAPTVAGTYNVTAVIDDPNYDGSATATLTITKATPIVNWSAPGIILYGTPLSLSELRATASVPGTFSYVPGFGTVLNAGNQPLTVLFTPTDQATYAPVSKTISILVGRRAVSVTANDVTISHTAAFPTFTGVIANVVPGDVLTATYAADPTTTPGTYPIVPTLVQNAAAANYMPTLVNGTLTLTNASPVAVNNSYSGSWNGPLTVAAPGVRANDTDADGDALTAALVAGPAHGTVALNADGSFVYTPAANYTGADSFTYRVSDGYATSNIATVSLTVTSPCRVDRDGKSEADDCARGTAIAKNDRYVAAQNTTLTVTSPNVLTNDGPFAQSAVLVTNAAHGTVTLAANGAFTYVPAAGYYGADTFQYTARNTAGVAGPAATVTLIVRANLAPDADDDVYATSRNTKLTVSGGDGVLANDSDPENDAITVQVVTGPAHGTLTLNANGGFVYTPAAGYTGVDTFTYTARDPFGHTDVATVRLYVGVSRGNDRGGSKHKDNDDCDHERGRNGHFKGDGCEHDRGGE